MEGDTVVAEDELDTPPEEHLPPDTQDRSRDEEAEKQRFCEILEVTGQAYLHRDKVYIKIPQNGNGEKPYPITSNSARAWAFAVYASLYPNEPHPLVKSYRVARDMVWSTLLHESDDVGESPDVWKQKLEQVRQHASRILPSSDLRAEFAVVPYIEDDPELSRDITGIWRLDRYRSARLTDMFVEVQVVTVPAATGQGKDYHYTLKCINDQGIEKTFDNVPRADLEDEGLDAKLKGYASWPTLQVKKGHLLEALDTLARQPGVKRLEEADSLGWQTCEELGLVWQCNNGIETRNGFIPAEHAPFLPPDIKSPGNGYSGTGDVPEPGDEIWTVIHALNNSNAPRIYAKLCAALRVMLPPGSIIHEPVERAGKLPFPIETIGAPRHGKTAEDNFILSLFGTGFRYDRETLLQANNTAIGRIGIQSRVRHCLYSDYDHKASDQGKDFDKHHQARKKEIEHYSDGADGGTVGKREGGYRSRGNPTGGILITGNYDHALKSIEEDEMAYEERIMTFLWPEGDRSDDDFSRGVNEERIKIYAWGVALRRWLMEKYMAGIASFAEVVSTCYDQARSIVTDPRYDWMGSDLHRNHTIECVAMELLWQEFLKELWGNRYTPSYLAQWLEKIRPVFIEDRLKNCQRLKKLYQEHKDEQNLAEFVLDTIRTALASGQIYLLSQKGIPLRETEVQLPITSYGYRITGNNDVMVSPGAMLGGYYLRGGQAIGFITDVLYRVLTREASSAGKRIPLPPHVSLFRQLADKGIVRPTLKDGAFLRYDQSVKVQGKALWLVVIPHDTLFPPVTIDVGETYIDEDGEQVVYAGGLPGNVVPFQKQTPMVAVSEPVPNVSFSAAVQVINNNKPEASSVDPFELDEDELPIWEGR